MSLRKIVLAAVVLFSISAFAKDDMDRGLPEWLEVQTKIQVLRTKIKAKEEIVKKLIIDKESAKDEEQSRSLVNQLTTEYKDLTESIDEYEKMRSLLKYRYPEKGHKGDRKYERLEAKPLDEMEKQLSLEGRIRHTIGKVRQQYPDTPKPAKETKSVVKSSDEPVKELEPKELTDSEKRVTEPSAVSK